MAIHLNNAGRPYNDETGHFVSWSRALKSSIFREELEERDLEDDERFIEEQLLAEEIGYDVETVPVEITPFEEPWDDFMDVWDSYIDDFDLDEDEIGAS